MRDPYEHYGSYRRTDSKHKSRMPVIALGVAALTGAWSDATERNIEL